MSVSARKSGFLFVPGTRHPLRANYALPLMSCNQETAVIRHIQERMPSGLFKPDVPRGTSGPPMCFLSGALQQSPPNPYTRVPETPPRWESGRGFVLANQMQRREGARFLANSGIRLIVRALREEKSCVPLRGESL
jgi:hypothetical protein